jgi:hypothetical protein
MPARCTRYLQHTGLRRAGIFLRLGFWRGLNGCGQCCLVPAGARCWTAGQQAAGQCNSTASDIGSVAQASRAPRGAQTTQQPKVTSRFTSGSQQPGARSQSTQEASKQSTQELLGSHEALTVSHAPEDGAGHLVCCACTHPALPAGLNQTVHRANGQQVAIAQGVHLVGNVLLGSTQRRVHVSIIPAAEWQGCTVRAGGLRYGCTCMVRARAGGDVQKAGMLQPAELSACITYAGNVLLDGTWYRIHISIASVRSVEWGGARERGKVNISIIPVWHVTGRGEGEKYNWRRYVAPLCHSVPPPSCTM